MIFKAHQFTWASCLIEPKQRKKYAMLVDMSAGHSGLGVYAAAINNSLVSLV